MALMRVSELARRSGVAATTLRYYKERGGLLPAQRSPAGYRLHGERALDRLAFITTARRLGLDLEGIGGLTALRSARPGHQPDPSSPAEQAALVPGALGPVKEK